MKIKKINKKTKINIIKFQIIIKDKIYFIKRVNDYIKNYKYNINSLTLHLSNNIKDIFSNVKYNLYIEKIIEIKNKIDSLNFPVGLRIFKKYDSKDIKNILNNISNLISEICETIGDNKITNIISILLKNKIKVNNEEFNNVIKYYNKYFVAINSKLIKDDNIILNISDKLPFLKK